jgi:hypothetical protein
MNALSCNAFRYIHCESFDGPVFNRFDSVLSGTLKYKLKRCSAAGVL